MMGSPGQSLSPPHQYPEAIQLKLYQAFIFSIPILFSIILFLLFYLFYLKRRASGITSSSPPVLPRTIHDTTHSDSSELKNDDLLMKNKLCTILFDEYMQENRDSVCCVCLGEYEVKEELVEVGWCRHIFHPDCIRQWLRSNSTCPLCRAPVLGSDGNSSKFPHHPPPPATSQSDHHRVAVPTPPMQEDCTRSVEGSSSSSGGGSSSSRGST